MNGQLATEPGMRVDPERDVVCMNGRRLRPEPRHYILIHKPRGVLCTCRDPEGRPTVLDLLPRTFGVRLYSVGRLDCNSEGLLLLTNDGELAARLIHPRHHVRKRYRVWTRPALSRPWLSRFVQGIESDGERLRAIKVRQLRCSPTGAEYEFELLEGRNRQIRRMVECAGGTVVRLVRIQIGPLTLGRLLPGQWRRLSVRELGVLRKAVQLSEDATLESARECNAPLPPASAGS